MSTATKGRRTEWKVRDALRRAGYIVTRAAGSRGPCDLVAWLRPGSPESELDWICGADCEAPPSVLFVNVKTRHWPPAPELLELARSCPDNRLVILWPDRKPPKAALVNWRGLRELEAEATDWFRAILPARLRRQLGPVTPETGRCEASHS